MAHAPYRLLALIEPDPCPCEGCARSPRCKTELLACSAFALYYIGEATPEAIDVAPGVDASRERYVKLMGR